MSRPVNQHDLLQVEVFVASALDFRSQVPLNTKEAFLGK